MGFMDAFNKKADEEVVESTSVVDIETSKGGNREELNKSLDRLLMGKSSVKI